MGERLTAVADMPAVSALLKLPAGQSDLQKKMHGPITNRIGNLFHLTHGIMLLDVF